MQKEWDRLPVTAHVRHSHDYLLGSILQVQGMWVPWDTLFKV